MSVTLEQIQSFEGQDVLLHLIKDDGTLDEVTGKVEKATVAGVAFRIKGKPGIELLTVTDGLLEGAEEIGAAPVKPKAITQKKIQPIPEGSMRQHLADRHGVSLKWCKEATEEAAVEFHNTLDHADLGHQHVAKDEKPATDERAEALADSPAA